MLNTVAHRSSSAAIKGHRFFVHCKTASGRPTLDDVQRISQGDAAKKRGTGSRQVPHRLNADERKAYDIAKTRKYMTLQHGSQYRRERRGSPLANIWRLYVDVVGHPVVLVEQSQPDTVIVDLSTLRQLDTSQMEAHIKHLAAENFNLEPLSKDQISSPFTVILATELIKAIDDDVELDDETKMSVWQESAIWQLPPRLIGFSCDRNTGKALSKLISESWNKM